MNTRRKGGAGEAVVLQHYLDHGYQHIISNFTIRGGEIDLIVENENTTIFIEVKVVDHIDDLFGYVTEKKLYYLHKTIGYRMRDHVTKIDIRLDVAFVREGKIVEIYENIGL